ncbi:hypothetical protein V3C99_005654, partial [Haemonchus contortus]
METGSYQSQPQEPDVATQMNTLAVTEITNKMEKTKPQVSGSEGLIKRLRREIKEIVTQADMALAQFFTTSDKRRTVVLEAISDKISTVLALVESLNEQSAANTTVSHEDVEDTLQKLCDVNECALSDLIKVTLGNISKINDLQIENAQLRKKRLEKRREELYGPEGTRMDGESDPHKEVLTNNDSDRELSLQLMKKMKPPRRETTLYLSSGQTGMSSEDSENESSVSQRVRSNTRIGSIVDETMRDYFRSLAMPDIKVFNNESNQKFEDFIRTFKLKYPRRAYSEKDRKEILVGYLGGEAKLHYNTLSSTVKNSPFDTVVKELKNRMRLESQESQAEALRAMRMLKKKKHQSVVQFCLELELLSSKAYPSCDEAALALIRAEVLHEQLREWPEAYHLYEILTNEEGYHVYERMKDAALRIEHLRKRRYDFNEKKLDKRERSGPGLKQQIPKEVSYFDSGRRSKDPSATQDCKLKEQQPKGVEKKPNTVKCAKCGKKGHSTEECWSRKDKREAGNSFSATLKGWSCSASTPGTKVCSLIGPKHMVKLQCLGLELPAMIDTGSQLTIMPLSFLLKAKKAGADVDTLCKEVKSRDMEVFDASGNLMSFLGCMETELKLLGGGTSLVQMHVKRLKDEVLLLGTNALEALGIRILISTQNETQIDCDKTEGAQGKNHQSRNSNIPQKALMAVVAKRSYVKPKTCSRVQVRCGQHSKDAVLWSHNRLVESGVCSVSEKGVAEVPVFNNLDEPVIFKEGETIGEWSQHKWVDPRLVDAKSDMLELSKEHTTEGRMKMLLDHLSANKKSGQLSQKLRMLVQEFADVFAVSDHELTQTDLVQHDIDTGNTKPIKQKVRPVPRGVQPEFKAILSDLEARGVIAKSNSDWASPVVLVQKKDKTLRLCIDYRVLNKHTKQDSYPLPTIDTVLQSLTGKKYFSTLDMASGYWQVKLSSDAQRKSAFTTPEGLFEFKVLPFGLSTSPAIFQRLMDMVLSELKGDEVFVYIDDILV